MKKDEKEKAKIIRRMAACHEAAHALIAWLSPELPKVRKVWVGRKLKYNEPSAWCDIPEYSRTDIKYLKARMAMLVAGPVAIEMIYKQGHLGSANDILEAKWIAENMVCKYGHCDALDNRQFPGYHVGGCSPKIRKKIEKETRKLLIEAVHVAQDMLIDKQKDWEKVVEYLLKRERINFRSLERILGPRPKP